MENFQLNTQKLQKFKEVIKVTNVYFVRHAEPNHENHDDASRELTNKGLKDRKFVTEFLMDKNIDAIVSSPYKSVIDTVREFAEIKGKL